MPTPTNFANSTRLPDNVAGLGISGYEINQGFALGIVPNVIRLAQESRRLDDGYGVRPSPLYYTPLAYSIKAMQPWRTVVFTIGALTMIAMMIHILIEVVL